MSACIWRGTTICSEEHIPMRPHHLSVVTDWQPMWKIRLTSGSLLPRNIAKGWTGRSFRGSVCRQSCRRIRSDQISEWLSIYSNSSVLVGGTHHINTCFFFTTGFLAPSIVNIYVSEHHIYRCLSHLNTAMGAINPPRKMMQLNIIDNTSTGSHMAVGQWK